MRNIAILSLCAALLFCLSASAQKAVLFGGYQLTRLDFGADSTIVGADSTIGSGTFTLNGWNASATGRLAPLLGITADFSGAYKSGSKLHTYTFGPEVHANVAGFRPFAHALIGGGTSDGPVSNGATSGLVMFYGGGLDVKVAPFASVRLGQFDWMVTHWNGFTNKSNFRYSAGLVLRF